ncbi:MAG TPA: tetratricopeptide repeat-containing glycosyltransferase family protein [Candidatus Angelobacter sp.]|nr:tetratricopeptide repeat-containing glycosyltransferase family protein [Candidatus Angelobacter sp.]
MTDEVALAGVQEAIGMMQRGDYLNATIALEKILIKDPKLALAWNNRALCLLQMGHPFDALLNIEKALEIEPNQAAYYNNKGAMLEQEENYAGALDAYYQALEFVPGMPEAWNNVGNTKKFMGDLPGAIEGYRKSIENKPDYADAHLHLACALLADGEYEEGWKEFEWRWRSQLTPRGLSISQWEGENLNGKTLFIYAEQGHGDTLNFIRYVTEVKKKYNCYVIVEVRQPLFRLVSTVKGIDKVIHYGDKLPEADYCTPMMSLPRILGTTVETIPADVPYFHIASDHVKTWAERLTILPPGLKVGICWAGMSRPGTPAADRIDQKRSTTLQNFAPVALVPGVMWVSLQKGPPAEQVKEPPPGMTIGDWMDDADDFYDTAALIENLDLVISVDTAVLHVAAALGKPTWLLSRYDGCWRWLGTRKDSPWYPTLTQFYQPKPNDWVSVMKEVSASLRQYVSDRNKRAA